MVTGMWMVLLLSPAWLALVEFFWLSASSCFSPRLRLLCIASRGLEARPPSTASGCRSLRDRDAYLIRYNCILSSGCVEHFLQRGTMWESSAAKNKPQLMANILEVALECYPNTELKGNSYIIKKKDADFLFKHKTQAWKIHQRINLACSDTQQANQRATQLKLVQPRLCSCSLI